MEDNKSRSWKDDRLLCMTTRTLPGGVTSKIPISSKTIQHLSYFFFCGGEQYITMLHSCLVTCFHAGSKSK